MNQDYLSHVHKERLPVVEPVLKQISRVGKFDAAHLQSYFKAVCVQVVPVLHSPWEEEDDKIEKCDETGWLVLSLYSCHCHHHHYQLSTSKSSSQTQPTCQWVPIGPIGDATLKVITTEVTLRHDLVSLI